MNSLAKCTQKTRPKSRPYLRVSLFCLAGLTFLPGPISAQLRSQPSPADPTKTYTITGTVINAITGEPINRALVQVPGRQAIMTSSDGAFEFTGLLAGMVYLQPRKPGFFNDQELHPERQPAFIKTDEVKNPIVVKLTPQSVISGRITDSNGEPLENIPVSVFSISTQDGRKRRMFANQSSTSEDGEFRISGLKPGQYFLSAGAGLAEPPSQLAPIVKAAKKGLPKMYYPGVPDRAEATPISVSPGQHGVIDLSLPAVPLYEVSVRVMGTPPTAGVGLQVLSPDGDDAAPLFNFYDPDTGVHRFSVPRGSYIISTSVQITSNQRQQILRAQTQVNVTSDLDNIVLALAPTDSIPIEIRTEFTKPDSPNSSPNFRPSANVYLIPDTPFGNDQFAQPENSQNPSLVLKNIEPGKYWVQVDKGYGYVQSLRCGPQDLTREPLTIAAGQHLPPIELVLRDDAATLNVSIRSDAPIKERPAVFALSGAGNPQIALTMSMSWMSGPNGIIAELNNLAPGDYTIYAFDNVANLEYRNPDVLSAYSSHAAHVTLAPNGNTNATVDLIHVEE